MAKQIYLLEPTTLTSGEVLSHPTTSNWLHDALRQALKRDPADALYDAEFLLSFLVNRLNVMEKVDA